MSTKALTPEQAGQLNNFMAHYGYQPNECAAERAIRAIQDLETKIKQLELDLQLEKTKNTELMTELNTLKERHDFMEEDLK
jgi:hypothetical protein